MACEVTEALVEDVDFVLDLDGGRIKFLSTGALGPTFQEWLDGGGCYVQVRRHCLGPVVPDVADDSDCVTETCCAPDDLDQSSQDADNCPEGYVWNGFECVPDDCVVQTTELPDGDVGVEYMANVAAEGFLMQFTWSLQGGSLPDGLTLNEDGMITGTPTVAGTFTFIVEATPFA